jgi:disulfide bond formation protein DsbB
MPSILSLIRTDRAAMAALLVALGGAATIAGAWYFQLVVGLPPCPLCLEQRIPYYVAIPLAMVLLAAIVWRASLTLVRLGLVLLAVAMLIGAGLGVYHAGVEWHFWPGPTDCSGQLNQLGGPGGLLGQLSTVRVVRCDEAAWRFLGLSLAGYNALISLLLAGVALWGIKAAGPAKV